MQEVHRLRGERKLSQDEEAVKDTKILQLLETTQKLNELNDYNVGILHRLKDGHVDEQGRLLISHAEDNMKKNVEVKSQLLARDSVPTYSYLSNEQPTHRTAASNEYRTPPSRSITNLQTLVPFIIFEYIYRLLEWYVSIANHVWILSTGCEHAHKLCACVIVSAHTCIRLVTTKCVAKSGRAQPPH